MGSVFLLVCFFSFYPAYSLVGNPRRKVRKNPGNGLGRNWRISEGLGKTRMVLPRLSGNIPRISTDRRLDRGPGFWVRIHRLDEFGLANVLRGCRGRLSHLEIVLGAAE